MKRADSRALLLDFRAYSPSGIERYAVLTVARLIEAVFGGWQTTALAFADQRSRLLVALERLGCELRSVERPASSMFEDVRRLVDVTAFDHIHFWHPLAVRVLEMPFSATLYDDLRIRLPQLNDTPPPVDEREAVAAEYERALRAAGAPAKFFRHVDEVGRFYRLNLACAARCSTLDVTCSEWAARTLSGLTGTATSKWRALPPRADEVSALWRLVRARRPAGLASAPFVLHVGGVTAHHRPDLVWPALSRQTFADHTLVIVGSDWGSAVGTDFGDAPVTRLAEVDDSELRWLYEQCAALLVASVREGYCLPVAEAAVHRRPVIHTRTPGIVEALALTDDARPLAPELDEAVRTSVRLEDW